MHDIHLVLQKLNDYYSRDELVEDLQTRVSQVQANTNYDALINDLTEICTECRQTRESNVFDNTHDSWECFSKIVSIKHMTSYFSGLLELPKNNPTNFVHQKLSIIVCRTYILLLTSPGAKIFDAFEPPLLSKVFKIVSVLKQLTPFKEHQRIQLQMLIIILLEDFVLYLKHVSFEDYEDLQTDMIDATASILQYHHENGLANKYSCQIQELCYAVLEHVCLPLHGSDMTVSLNLVLNGTAHLHKFSKAISNSTSVKLRFNSISEWFIDMLKHYPRQMSKTLQCYIKAVLTDDELNLEKDVQVKFFDYCAQYDAALIRICGESLTDYVEQVSYSKETQHRLNCIELIGRVLVINSKCDWELFRHELSTTPREIKLLRILLQKLYDQNNVVSLKAINIFLKITTDGNIVSKEIIEKCFMNDLLTFQYYVEPISPEETEQLSSQEESSVDSEVEQDERNERSEQNRKEEKRQRRRRKNQCTDYTKSKDYSDLVTEIRQNLVRAVGLQIKNSSALIRRSVLLFMEFLSKTKLDYNTVVASWDFRQLFVDQSPLVRRQLILSLDRMMNVQPTNDTISMAWVKAVLDLASDTDAKIIETVIDSFKANIFDRIQNYENSSLIQHIFPWRLLRVMLKSTDSPDFRISMHKWMNKNLLNSKTLAKIETHLDTNNATEAWILLAMVAPNIKGHNPERVSKLLLQNLKYDMATTSETCHIKLEVLVYWMKYLNNPSKNEINRLMTEMLEMGSLKPRNVNRVFGICFKLCSKSGKRENQEFVSTIERAAGEYILSHRNIFFVPNLCDERLISYLYVYAEIASVMDHEVNTEIAELALTFLKMMTDGTRMNALSEKVVVLKLNCIQSVLTGFSSFNVDICSRFVPLLGKLLRDVDQSETCFTAIKCLGYLCRKNTAVVESVVPHILSKTQHKYSNIREYALKMLATLILEDYLKMRGSLLIYIMASFLDTVPQIRELAMELVMKYTLEKNEAFLCSCLLECPFVFNGCAYFGQSATVRSASENVLRGAENQAPREYIYRYLMKKIDSVQLYMYYGNFSKLAEYIEKSKTLRTSDDEQRAVVDFVFVCTEICSINAKHKRSVDKIVRATQNGEKPAADEHQLEMEAEAAAAAEAGVGNSSGRGGRSKKTQMTMAQSLVVVERVVPHIVQVTKEVLDINIERFETLTSKLCSEMCGHFEAIFEYAQPRKFWTKYMEIAKKKAPSSAAGSQRCMISSPKSMQGTSRVLDSQQGIDGLQTPVMSEKSQTISVQDSNKSGELNDSGQHTLDDSYNSVAPSEPQGSSEVQLPSERRSTKNSRSAARRKLPRTAENNRSTRPSARSRVYNYDSDDDSVISDSSSCSKISRTSTIGSASKFGPSTSRDTKSSFKRKTR